jgi:hypothetical protein
MSPTVQGIYNDFIESLAPTDRLSLATLILNGLVQQNISIVDEQDYWTEEDETDILKFSLQHAASMFPDEEAV